MRNIGESSEIQIPRLWNISAKRELLELYFDGMDAEMLGWHFGVKPHEVYIALCSLLFGLSQMHEDPTAPRFRKRWETLEDSELIRLYRRSFPVETIALQLGRDVPGVAMRLISSWWATCPPDVARSLRLSEDDIQISEAPPAEDV